MNKLRKFGFLVLAVICALFVFTSCRRDKGPTAEEAAARISTTVDKTVVTKDFVVNNSIVLEGVTFTVTWESNNAVAKVGTEKVGSNGEVKENGGFYLVSIGYETNTADQNVTLTATVANGKDTAQKSISFTVPKFATATFAEYAAADKETSLTVDGIVTGILSKTKGDQDNALFLNALDNTGGFYIYKLEKDPVTEGIKEGMTVRASGQKDLYSGTYEIVDPSVRIIDETIKTVAPVDLTAAYTAAADLKDAALVGPQALLVTIKGVTITSAAEDNGYYKFKLGDKESYIRISSSNCPLNVEETKKFKEDFAAHTGYLANATGVVSVYNGAFYLQPVSVNAFEYLSLPELSDAEQVAYEKEGLSISATKFAADSTINLALKGSAYKDVAISWASNSEQVVIGTDGKATVTLGSKSATVKLTATLTKGEVTDTKEFTLELSSVGGIEIVDPEDGKTYYFGFYQPEKGEYLFINGETVPKNPWYHKTTSVATEAIKVTVKAVEGGYQLSFLLNNETNYFKAYKDGTHYSLVATTVAADATAFVYDTERQVFTFTIEGQLCYVACQSGKDTVSSNLDKYLDSMYFAHLYEIEDPENFGKDEEPKEILSVTQALAATSGTIVVTGKISEIKKEEYGNIYITDLNDETKKIYIYGIYDEDGKKYGDWDASLKTLAVGQTITLIGERSEFNNEAQVKNCKIYVPTEDEPTEDQPTEEPTYTEMTTAEAVAAADGTKVQVSGTVVAENAQGFIIKDAAGLLNVFGKTAYDKSLEIGDVVTVKGDVASYKGSKQISNPTFEKTSHADYTQPTPTEVTDIVAFATANETVAPTQYIKLAGKLVIDGNFHNVVIEGVSTHQGSLYNVLADYSALNGKNVVVEAYFLYVTGSTTKYVTIVVVSITEVEVHEHEAATEWLKDATHHWHACATCQEEVQLDKAAHTGGTATCKDKAVCEVCGESYGELLTTHTWNNGEVTTEPTEEAPGVKTFTCTTCNTTKTEPIPELGHTHSWATEWSTDGENHWYECTGANCSDKKDLAAHTGGTATCKDKAVCEVCGESYGELLTTHTWNEGEQTKAPSYTEEGKKTYTCTVCGDVKDESIPQLVSTVAQFLEAKDTTNDRVLQGYVTAVNAVDALGSFVLTDAAGDSIFCFTGLDVKLGDEIIVKGKYKENYTLPQIDAPQLVSTISENNNVVEKSGTPVNLTAEEVKASIEGTTNQDLTNLYNGKYLVIKGYILKKDSYFGLADVSTGTAYFVNIYANSGIKFTELVGKEVILSCFLRGVYGNKNITVQVQSVVEYVKSNAELAEEAKEALTIEGNLSSVMADLVLPVSGLNGAEITWASSNAEIISGAGVVVRPSEDTEVTLTATIKVGDAEVTKEFKVTVIAEAANQDEDDVLADKALLPTEINDTENYELITEGTNGSTISWEIVGETEYLVIEEGVAKVTRPSFSAGDQVITLKATISKGEAEETLEVTFTIAKGEATIAEVLAAEDGTKVEFEGLVQSVPTGWYSQNGYMSVVLIDGENEILVYRLAKEVKIYNKIKVTGEVETDNGVKRIKAGATATVLTINDQEKLLLAKLNVNTDRNCGNKLTLETSGILDSTISWKVKEENTAISITNNVAKVVQGAEDVEVVLIATVTLGTLTAEVEVTVTVAAEAPIATEATISFASKDQRTVYNSNQQVWEQNGIIFTNNKAASSNSIADYAAPVRLYAGSSITIEYAAEITKIEITCNSTTYANDLKNSIGNDATVNSKVVTITLASPALSYTVAKLSKQVRIDSLKVFC